jgi:hypothetical protein
MVLPVTSSRDALQTEEDLGEALDTFRHIGAELGLREG